MKIRITITLLMLTVLSCVNTTNISAVDIPEPASKPESWNLVWQDEFDYNGLPDPSVWTFETEGNDIRWGNGEDQYYTVNRLENAEVKNGVLQIKAQLEDYHQDFKYTSARINSALAGGWLYGKFEVRAKLPEGRGVWPAIWMLPMDSVYGSWPDSGEIDIMEYFSHLPGKSYSTIHTKTYNHKIGTSKDGHIESNTLHNVFHTYSLEWYPDRLEFYFDDNLVMMYENPYQTSAEWPFDKPFHILLNCAIGGDWIRESHGIDDSLFPHIYEIDYVRVYEGVYPGEHELNTNTIGDGHIEADGDIVSGPLTAESGKVFKLTPVSKEGYVFRRWAGDASGTQVPLEVTLGQDKSITAVFANKGELLFNSGFDLGLSGWSYWADKNIVSSKHYVEDRTFHVDINKKGREIWQAQLNQMIDLDADSEYIVEFEACGSVKETIVGFQQSHEPYKSYWSNNFKVDPEWKKYEFRVKLNEVGEQIRLEFNFGNSKGYFKLRNSSVRKVI